MSWQVASDARLQTIVAGGKAIAEPETDFTVKVDVTGLEPGTVYWYVFEAGPVRSPVGRTRTAPAGLVERLTIGVVSCAHWAEGFFNAYRALAERDVDLVIHLGDYLYEEDRRKSRGVRLHGPPRRAVSLADYRARHAQYKTDPDLRFLHGRHPMAAVWDDHELAGNAWRDGATRHDPGSDGPWAARREAAVRAYLEWMPLRSGEEGSARIWRSLQLGDLCDVILLDTRLDGRESPAAGKRPVVGVRRRDRALLGDEQRQWLAEELDGPGGRWRLLVSQVVVAPIHVLRVPDRLTRVGRWLGAVDGGLVVNSGQWDGYPEERERLLRLLERRPGEVVVVSADLHSSWASELELDHQAVAAEFVTPSVTATSFAEVLAPPVPGGQRILEAIIRRQNRHIRYVDTNRHGYLLLDVRPDRVEAQWWHVDTVDRGDAAERCSARWTLRWGDPHLVEGS